MKNNHRSFLCVVLMLVASVLVLPAQAVSAASTTSSPVQTVGTAPAPQKRTDLGIVLVQKAIAAMGGDAWSVLGAATAETTVTDPRGKSVSSIVSSDWSGKTSRHKRESGASTEKISFLEDGPLGLSVKGSKRGMTPAAYDLVRLAQIYPAISLRLGIQRGCLFRLQTPRTTPVVAEHGAVSMLCAAPSYPGHLAHFLWWFDSSTGLPRQVQVPILTMDGQHENHQVLHYSQYTQISGLIVPGQVQTTDSTFVLSTETVSKVTFATSLPETTFALPNQK